MAHHNTVLAQLLKLLPRHEFEKLANRQDGKRKSSAMTRWTQFVALTIGHLGGRSSLRDIEATTQSQSHLNYHLGSQAVSRSAFGRANEKLDYRFFEALFQTLYQRMETPDVLERTPEVMNLLLQILQVHNVSCHEEAFFAIGAVAANVEEKFVVS